MFQINVVEVMPLSARRLALNFADGLVATIALDRFV